MFWLLFASALARVLVVSNSHDPVVDYIQSHFPVTVRKSSDAIEFFKNKEPIYDNVLVMDYGNQMSNALLAYLRNGKNVLLFHDDKQNNFLNELGFFVLDKVYDVENKKVRIETIDNSHFFSKPNSLDVDAYGHISNNQLSGNLCKANIDLYSISNQKLTTNVQIISSFQALNNARLIASGTKDILKSPIIKELVDWTFKLKSIVHLSDVTFESSLRINSPFTLKVKTSMPLDDLQFELNMIDPYVRKNIKDNVTIQLPNKYGIFTLAIHYFRHGLNYIDYKERVVIKPPRHNDYERFVIEAYPYYAATFSLMAGWLLLVGLLIFTEQ